MARQTSSSNPASTASGSFAGIKHSMVLTLERRGFIRRVPGQARSIVLLVPPESLPPLQRIPR